MDEQLYSDFIRGIFDGDGWIHSNSNSREFGICSSYEICNFIKDYFSKYEIEMDVSLNNSSSNNELYRVRTFKKSNIIKIRDTLYYSKNIIYLDRKYKKFCELF